MNNSGSLQCPLPARQISIWLLVFELLPKYYEFASASTVYGPFAVLRHREKYVKLGPAKYLTRFQ